MASNNFITSDRGNSFSALILTFVTAPKIQIHIICQVILAVLLCKILESRRVFKSVYRYNVLIFHSSSPGESVRALTVLIDVLHVNSGSPLSFPVCSNKIKSGRFNEILWAGVFNKTIVPFTLVGYEMIIANTYPTRLVGYLPSHIQRALLE